MKKLILLLTLISSLALMGCGSKEPDVAESGADPAAAGSGVAPQATPGAPTAPAAAEATTSGVQDTPVNSLGDK
jgi:hypothetical protein